MGEIKSWVEKSRELFFQKYSRKIEKVIFALPNGVESDFYIKAEGPAVAVLGLTPEQEVVLVKQYRPGPKLILNELPGGYVNKDEHPLDSAEREFKEETGYEGEFELAGVCLDDAYSTMKRYCYVAKNCHKVSEPISTDTEQTEVVICSLSDFRKLLQSGLLTDIEAGYIGLDHLGLLK